MFWTFHAIVFLQLPSHSCTTPYWKLKQKKFSMVHFILYMPAYGILYEVTVRQLWYQTTGQTKKLLMAYIIGIFKIICKGIDLPIQILSTIWDKLKLSCLYKASFIIKYLPAVLQMSGTKDILDWKCKQYEFKIGAIFCFCWTSF